MRQHLKTTILIILLSIIQNSFSQETLIERLTSHVYTLASDSLMGRSAGTIYAQKSANYITSQWEAIGIEPLVDNSYFMNFYNHYNNLVGIIEGKNPKLKDEYIIVGAHYDHLGSKKNSSGNTIIYNGADDNASGTAVLIELGRKLTEVQQSLGRSVILIAFDAEELGLFGSNEFANNPPIALEKIKLMLSLDMVGWYKTSGYLLYYGVGTIKNGKQYLSDANSMYEKLNVKTKKFEKNSFSATDTYGFANKGIPTLAVTTGLKSPYHKPTDEADLIDYEGMALITEHLFNIIKEVSNAEEYKATGKISSKHKMPKLCLGISANVGTNYHHYTAGAIDGKKANGYGVGLAATFNQGSLGFRQEVYYDYIMANHPNGKISTHGLTVPFNLILQTKNNFPAGFAIFAGPYYSYKFKGKQGKNALDFENVFNREEFGINFGLELRFFNFWLGVTGRNALTNFTREKNTDNAHIRNRASYLTITHVF